MKKSLVFFLLIAFFACEQAPEQATGLDLTGFESEKIPGTSVTRVFKLGEDGKMLEEGFIKDGVKNGQWITYDPSKGAVNKIESFVDGQLTGYSFIISSRGYIDQQAGFLNNTLHGRNYNYRYGRPKSELFYSNGQLDGIQKEYYDNGKLQQETEFKDGIQDGVYNYYSDDGILRMSYMYENGEKVSGGIIEEETTEAKED